MKIAELSWAGVSMAPVAPKTLVEDEVVEVLREETNKSRLSTYTDYINTFLIVSLVRRNLAF